MEHFTGLDCCLLPLQIQVRFRLGNSVLIGCSRFAAIYNCLVMMRP